MMFHFYNTCLNSFNISFRCSGEIIISSSFMEFVSGTGFGFTILLAIFFSRNSPVASAALWATFLVAVFKVSSHNLVVASNNYLL